MYKATNNLHVVPLFSKCTVMGAASVMIPKIQKLTESETVYGKLYLWQIEKRDLSAREYNTTFPATETETIRYILWE